MKSFDADMSRQKTFANNDEKKSLEITFVNADYERISQCLWICTVLQVSQFAAFKEREFFGNFNDFKQI